MTWDSGNRDSIKDENSQLDQNFFRSRKKKVLPKGVEYTRLVNELDWAI